MKIPIGWLINKIKSICRWLWYWVFDPRGLKPSEIKKTLDKGFEETHNKQVDSVLKVSENADRLRTRFKGKGRKIFTKKKK